MRLNVTSFEKIVWLWFPCAVGSIDFLGNQVAGVSIQQLLSLLCYLAAIILWFDDYKLNKVNPLIILWLSCVLVSVVLSSNGVYQFIQFFALLGAVAWSLLLIRLFTLDELVHLLARVSKFYALISVVYILLLPSHSYGYVNDGLAFSSFFEQKNTYGRFLFLAFFFNLLSSFWSGGRQGVLSFSFWGWTVLFLALLILSASKSAIVLSVFSVIVLVCVTQLSNGQFIKNALITLLSFTAIIIPLITFGFLFEYSGIGTALDCLHIYDSFCVPGTGRFTIWNAVIQDAFSDERLLWGYGYAVYFKELSEVYLSNIGLGGFIPHDPHNGFVDIFASMGAVGVTVYTILLLLAARGLRGVSQNEFVFFFVFVLVYVTSNFTESYFLKSTNIYPVLFYFYLNYYRNRKSRSVTP